WHAFGWMYHGSFIEFADYEHCRYFLMLGTGQGFEAEMGFTPDAKRMADARLRGMKLVVVDPRLSNAAAKADEWIPIRPGTDCAFLLGLLHTFLHELKVWDAKFLKQYTNAPYLIGEDGLYARDPESGKPLVWDTLAQAARPFDAADMGELALAGSYQLSTQPSALSTRTAFQALADHLAQYTPEWAEGVSAVPASTIRRVAREMAEAAQIGSFIELDEQLWPYRPVALAARTGLDAQAHAGMANRAAFMIATLLGILSTPGGNARYVSSSDIRTPVSAPIPPNADGIIYDPALDRIFDLDPSLEWPPSGYGLKDVLPFALTPVTTGHMHYLTGVEPERFGLRPEQAFFFDCTNPMHSLADPSVVEQVLQRAFVVVMDQYMTETAALADVVLPSSFNLERYSVAGVKPSTTLQGMQYSEPVIAPLHERRDVLDVLLDIGQRLRIVTGPEGFNARVNAFNGWTGEAALALDRPYAWGEIAQRLARSALPAGVPFEEVRQRGWWVRPLRAEEKYMHYRLGRIPFYPEYVQSTGEKLGRELEKIRFQQRTGLEIDLSEYAALPSWKPSPNHQPDPDYQLYAITYKPAMLSFGRSAFNPWLMELAERTAHSRIWMHPSAAGARGIKDGQLVEVASRWGKTRGRVKLTEGVFPECVVLPAILGHTVSHPIAHGRGAHFNSLLPLDWEHTEQAFAGLENKVRVQVAAVPA
ncbi:MAG: molybdopterin-dependent oxidoreductase, partial [Chloroflexota bacterium]|nr:molybdopterin-dependent oxidoreductase [Chloroflexota bacterium]